MPERNSIAENLRSAPALALAVIGSGSRQFLSSKQPQIWLMAGIIGLCVSIAAIAFRELIGLIQLFWLGDSSEHIASAARKIHWLWVLLTPAVGGLLVGWLLNSFIPTRRASGVADVIESCARGGRNLDFKPGLGSAFVTALSLGTGASAGREGPVVHLGATIATSISHIFSIPEWGRRTLLACGVASAVSASFNAPIAGVLFAHEVILGHYAKRAFVPIVISSVAGTMLTRQWFGEAVAFTIPDYSITSYWEFPAFALLGFVCAIVALIMQYAINGTDYLARLIIMPLWLRPAVGGLIIGAIGVFFPEILGVGYEATSQALTNQLPLTILFALLVLKTAATAITLASRFGGGVFSPSLYLGAMTGGAYGIIAAGVFPELASSQGIYSILGMGAVAASVLGAPFSTVVMVFELTGGYALSIALLLCVSISIGINQIVNGRSYFQRQLESRGVQMEDGPHKFLIKTTRVSSFMLDLSEDDDPYLEPDEERVVLLIDTPLEQALRAFDESGSSRLPVVSPKEPNIQVGWASQVGALRKYNAILIDTSVEEHR